MCNTEKKAEKNRDILSKMKKHHIYLILFNDLSEGNVEFLKKACNEFNLYDSQRMNEMNGKYPKNSNKLSDNIYENIIEIILEEVIDKENKELLKCFMDDYSERYPSVKDDAVTWGVDKEKLQLYLINKSKKCSENEICYTCLYNMIYGNKQIINYLTDWYSMSNLSIYESLFIKPDYIDIIEEQSDMKDLRNSKDYRNFMKKQKQILANYLGLGYDKIKEGVIRYGQEHYVNNKWKSKNSYMHQLYENIDQICNKYQICIKSVIENDNKVSEDIFNNAFETICETMFVFKIMSHTEDDNSDAVNEAYDCSKINMPKFNDRIYYDYSNINIPKFNDRIKMAYDRANIDNPELFFIVLVLTYYYEMLIQKVKELQEESYKTFSFDRIAESDREQNLLAENVRLKNEIAEYEEKLKQQESIICENLQEWNKEKKRANKEHESQIYLLKQQIEEKERIIIKQNQELSNMREYISYFENDDTEFGAEAETCSEDLDQTIIYNKKILFLGGRTDMVAKLKGKFSNATFIDNAASSFPEKLDMAVIFAKNMSHSLYQKFKSEYGNDIPIIYCNKSNVDSVIIEIVRNSRMQDGDPHQKTKSDLKNVG